MSSFSEALFIAPLVNINQIFPLRLNINSQDINIMVFSYSENDDQSIHLRDKEAIILKDSHKSNPDNLVLNYKYLPASFSNKSLMDNTTWILFNNSILESKYYHIVCVESIHYRVLK